MSTSNSERQLSADIVPRVRETVAWVEVDGEAVLYDEVGRRVHVLSPTATLVWSGFDGEGSLERIAQDLSDSFGADLAVVRSDVLELASELLEKGLITDGGPGATTHSARTLQEDARGGGRSTRRFLEEPPSG